MIFQGTQASIAKIFLMFFVIFHGGGGGGSGPPIIPLDPRMVITVIL